MEGKLVLSSLVILSCVASVLTATNVLVLPESGDKNDLSLQADHKCVYTVYVKTGEVEFAGTDSIISVELQNETGQGIRIGNLVSWGGVMGKGYDYFERRSLDIFTGTGQCFGGSPCMIRLTSDGQGIFPGWYCSNVEVTVASYRTNCVRHHFTVEQWLNFNTKLTAVRNNCHKKQPTATLHLRSSKLDASSSRKFMN